MSNLGNKQTMAKNLKKYMEINHKDRNDICNDLGFKYTTFADWINGKTYPRIDKIELMADYFGISKADLVEDKTDDDSYYFDKETRKIAQEIFENKELRLLFSDARNATPDDLKATHDILLALKRKERGEN